MPTIYGGHAVGERFGRKELFSYAGLNRFRHHLWYWLCLECEEVRGPSTLSHLKRATRCNDCAKRRDMNPRWLGHGDIPGVYLSQCKRDAEFRGFPFEVSPEYLWGKFQAQDGRCVYSGWLLSFGYKSETTASLDRIDSSKGYVAGNVQWVHKDVNRMKTDFTESRFIQMVQAISTNLEVHHV